MEYLLRRIISSLADSIYREDLDFLRWKEYVLRAMSIQKSRIDLSLLINNN